MYQFALIAIGLIVLTLGKRIAVMSAALGGLLGVLVLRILPGPTDSWVELLIPVGLAIAGFFLASFVSLAVNVVVPILGALGGALLATGILDVFGSESRGLYWLLAIVGGLAGWFLARTFKDVALIVLSGLIGGVLITRGLMPWFPSLQSELGTLLILVLAGGSVAFQSGFMAKRSAAAEAKAASQAQATAPVQPAVEGGSQAAGNNQ